MAIVYEKSKALTDRELHYCPGCHHGIIHKLIAETLEELNLTDEVIAVCPVGCSVFAGNYFNFDTQEAAHGRAPAVATGIKRTHPTQPGVTGQGDGGGAAHGGGGVVPGGRRGGEITTIFINNAIYGMTGGQMAPTTLIGQKATTAPKGRTKEQAGMPIRMAEMLSTLDGCVYAERVCVTDIPNINKAKKAIKKAFQKQMAGEGFTMIEVLSTCPTNWGMTPLKANEWLKNEMAAYYPLGVIKESTPEVK